MSCDSSSIKARASELGFDLCGIAPATALPELTKLADWLQRGYGGEMEYLHKSAATRADIRNFLPGVKTVIVTGTIYYTGDAPAKAGALGSPHVGPSTQIEGPGFSPDRVQIARYAWGEDYHRILSDRLEQLLDWMRGQTSTPFEAAAFVDKHHVQERVYARYAGLGWIGKNTCVINPELGSWLFLAGIAVTLDLEHDQPVTDQCGACTLCIDSCPTGALVEPYELDATRCISYLTIELKHDLPDDRRASVGNHIFGCDICQDVCPFNLAPLPTTDAAWQLRAGRAAPRAAELWQRSDGELHALIANSAMTRTTVSRLRRNIAVAMGNSGNPRHAAVLDRPGHGIPRAAPSAATPLVQEHVAWAKRRLAATDGLQPTAHRPPQTAESECVAKQTRKHLP